MQAQFRLHLDHLTRLDQLELTKHLTGEQIRFTPASTDSRMHGDLGLLAAAVIVSLPALHVLGLYLLRGQSEDHIERTVEVECPDGSRLKTTIRIDRNSSQAPEEQIAAQLAKTCAVDVSKIVGA